MSPEASRRIRPFRIGDEAALRAVFMSSIHGLALDYTPEQRRAWAPEAHDPEAWAARVGAIRPWVLELDGTVAGYADLQPTGYIDHFFVAAAFAGRGCGQRLMDHLHAVAREQGIPELWADVSLTAEPFFRRNGFEVERRKLVALRGVELANARMRKVLSGPPAGP